MPEGVGYGPQDTASTGLNLNVIGNHAYANSGSIIITNGSDATLLEFTTGSSYLVGTFAFGMNAVGPSTSKYFSYKMYINGELVFENASLSGPSNEMVYDAGQIVQDILLPPYANIKFEATTDDGSNITCYGLITGRLYGKID